MSVSSDLSVIAPQYNTTANRDRFIELAGTRVNRCLFGDRADYATALMAAHMITLSTSAAYAGGGAGIVASKKEGDLAITYAVNSHVGGEGDLGLTHWGIQFRGLSETTTAFIGVTGGNDCGCDC